MCELGEYDVWDGYVWWTASVIHDELCVVVMWNVRLLRYFFSQ